MLHLFSPLNPVGAVFFNIQVASKSKAITERLEEIARQTVELGLREVVGEKKKSRGIWGKLPTTSLVDDRVFGRVDDAKNLIESLRRDVVDDDLCVIPVVGLGGIGKTTLAQIVYNDKEVGEHFDLKAWVYVFGDFDLVRVTKAVLESLGESCFTSNLEPLQSALRKKLMMKKFLLVLDDLWNENYSGWDVLQLPFRAGARGSKIIVTTRSQTVAQTVNTAGPLFHLQQMSDDDCWLLFAQHAFSKLNSEVRPKLESIGKEIAKKCKGLPLATRALGGLLRSKLGVDEWQHILNSEVWELPHQQCGILPELSLSYYLLPSHLKPCFAYCAIFPKGYEFDEEKLVRLWIAEGLVQQREKHMQIEDVGSRYFHDLLSRSLFQCSNGNISRFIMHDLINDLAQFAAGERCFRWEEGINQGKNWKKARHLSYIQQRRGGLLNFEEFTLHKCLRTFLPLDGGFGICQITNKAVHHLLRAFSRLHVLSLSHYEITELPDLFSELKHLRYLDLSKTAIKLLPKSTATLYNLQTLILHGCRHLIQLPTNLGNLVNLQVFDIRGTKLQQLPPNIGRLKNLRTLPYFLVSKDSGSRIVELKDLLYLRGDLCILKLEYVEKDTDAMEANLKDKKNSQVQEYAWGEWICLGVGEFPCLNELCIENCPKLSKEIPGSLASLKTLKIRNCKELSSIPCFPHIQTLVLEECDRVLLESVLDLTSLEKLYLHKVAKLKHLPCEFFNRLVALHYLEVVHCDELTILSNQIGLPDNTSLQKLTIRKCSLIFLWPEEEQRLPPVLEYLEIACCNNMIK
ncbi:hypothetical protein Ddye_031747, partial [Dipteronia dyeriana]